MTVKNINNKIQKDPDEWKTGDEPVTPSQNSYVHTLADIADEEIPQHMTKAGAAKKIEDLQEKTGRKGGQVKKK